MRKIWREVTRKMGRNLLATDCADATDRNDGNKRGLRGNALGLAAGVRRGGTPTIELSIQRRIRRVIEA